MCFTLSFGQRRQHHSSLGTELCTPLGNDKVKEELEVSKCLIYLRDNLSDVAKEACKAVFHSCQNSFTRSHAVHFISYCAQEIAQQKSVKIYSFESPPSHPLTSEARVIICSLCICEGLEVSFSTVTRDFGWSALANEFIPLCCVSFCCSPPSCISYMLYPYP